MAAATAGLRAHWRCVDTIWQLATATPRLTDEVFCQLVKHTTLNGNRCGRGASCGRPTNSGSDGRVRLLGFRKYGGEGGGDGTAARGHSESALADQALTPQPRRFRYCRGRWCRPARCCRTWPHTWRAAARTATRRTAFGSYVAAPSPPNGDAGTRCYRADTAAGQAQRPDAAPVPPAVVVVGRGSRVWAGRRRRSRSSRH